MELRILGPTEVRHDGSPVTLRGSKPRRLLVLLAMRPNRPVLADELIDELWDGEPPPSAPTALRVHVGRLRQVLELHRDPEAPSGRLPAGPHGYLLRVEPDELDVQRFERLLVLAREADANGDPAAAVPRLTEALDLWRGAALADARDLDATRGEIARLDELRLVAIEELAAVRLALGEHALVIDVLRAAIKEHPLREPLTESLMRALYRSGRQAEALRAYSDLARRLDDDLGLAPSPQLRRLEEDVLLQRSSLDFVPARSAVPPVAPRRWSGVRFIGRRTELRRLGELYRDAGSGQRRAALVAGPPGIGKSSLVEELCAHIRSYGGAPLVGYCDPDPAGDYQPVAEILRALVHRLDDDARAGLAPVLQLVLPELADDTNQGDVVRDSYIPGVHFHLFDAIATTLERLADAPIVVVIEDLHWADRPTLALLRFLLRHPRLDRLFVVATLRDDESSGDRIELIERLAPRDDMTTVRLDGFGDYEVRALIRSAAMPETMPAIIDAAGLLQDVTGGNPYFLRELLRELDEEPAKLDDVGGLAQMLATIAPAGVRALVDRRRERLSDRGRDVLDAAAVLGREVSVDLLVHMVGVPNVEVFDALEESLAARLLVEDFADDDRYLFPHMLTRNAVYAAIAPERRAALHRRAGEALEQSVPMTARRCVDLARHFGEAAGLGVADKAAEYAKRAGDDALARFAFAEAARWYERAIALHEDGAIAPADAGRMQLLLGRTYAGDGRLDRARAAFVVAVDHARAVSDPALLAEIALAVAGPWTSGADCRPDALALLEEALPGIGTGDSALRVRVLNGIASDLYYTDPVREGELARDALAIAEGIDDPSARVTARVALHRWYTHEPAAMRERLSLLSATFDLSARAGVSPALRLVVHRSLLSEQIENGLVAEFDAGLDGYERMATDFGSPLDIYWATALRATQAMLHGDLVAAEQLARGAALRGRELEQSSAGAHLLQRFVVRFQQGRLAEELGVLRAMGEAASVYRSGAGLGAVAYAEVGHVEHALTITRETLGADGAGLPRDVFWLAAMSLFAGVIARAGEPEEVALMAEMLTPCADHVVMFGVGGAMIGTGHHWLGLLDEARGALDAALENLAEAVAISKRIDAPYWAAQAMVDAARVLRTRGRPADERESARMIRDARVLARNGGYGRVLAQADALH